MTLTELQAAAEELGLPRFAGGQLAGWLYGRQAAGFAEMTDLPREARAALAERYVLDTPAPVKETVSRDGTKKYLFAVSGEATAEGRFVEAAYIPEPRRATLCLSVQVGCKMGCLFCMTGRQGFSGNLTPGEILNQYRSLPEREAVTNLVYMGMGEPLDNLDNVLASLEILSAPWGYALSPGRITVSTVGLLPALESFLAVSRCHLAVSLHSPFEEERRRLVPIEKAHPLRQILAAVRAHGF
jgi:23S rRNA (adenine2503-C2)-methyltransferase